MRLPSPPPALLLAGLLAFAGCAAEPQPRRVVLITLDTLRLDAFAGAAGSQTAMPLTRARASRGLVFERFYAATSTTQPSHASMLTGLHPWQHGITRNGQTLDAGFATVAEVLAGQGYTTAAVVASYPLAGRFGFAQGFGEFRDSFDEELFTEIPWEDYDVPGGRFFSTAETVTTRALELLDRMDAGGAPRQFLWVHYFDAHAPYGQSTGDPAPVIRRLYRRAEQGLPTARLMERFRRGYRADVEYLDRWLDRLLARLEGDGDRYVTHVVAAADHGESFGEEGALGHGKRLTPEQIQVPLFILSPEVDPGVRRDVAASVDVAPTLLALAGLDPESSGMPGRDLTRRGAGAGARGMRRTFAGKRVERLLDGGIRPLPPYLFYVVDREGRLIRGDADGLADAVATPGEAQALPELFRVWQQEVETTGDEEPLDPEVERGLRALGYVD